MWVDDLISLFFPNVCPGCGRTLVRGEKTICSVCRVMLPVIRETAPSSAGLLSGLGGRIPLTYGGCLLYFQKQGIAQNLMHELKYNNRPDIGVMLGELFGRKLYETKASKLFDIIVPVPLHRARFERRGYNQSAAFARGLSSETSLQVSEIAVSRTRPSETQTRKSRSERIKNVEGIFKAREEIVKGKRILLVDDVFTTGATLESCSNAILDAGATSLGIATIAQAV